ncbi:EfeM/EfeO family lipoprotein [Gryllotalpicola ginsengisoli]|uniref:EfeM/EfeO family lipoprotein n=1 Tax=Gryllotalpicola ginsengisoli TaxID=444608 RepID=UPI0003B4874A|nr:EfeM/EfeO family lipoprotein [Gryllotalpicola ginsengisoli]
MSTRSQIAAFWAAIVVVVAVAVACTVLSRPGDQDAAHATDAAAHSFDVTVGSSGCGDGWGTDDAGKAAEGTLPGGEQSFTISNGSTGGVEVFLQNVKTKQVYLDLESVGPGAKAPARVTLGQGRYRFICFPADSNLAIGPTVTVGAAPSGSVLTPGVVPISEAQLIPVAKAYGRWVDGRLPTLQKQVAQLADDAEEGDLSSAKRDWLAAHVTYETLGAAYGAFGDYDAKINGTPASGKTALDDPDLTGFHKIEALLWSGAPAAKVAKAAAQLRTDVAALAKAPETDRIDPLDIGLRAHEIVENTIQFELTGETDAGSHTNLATVAANLEGAQHALDVLEDLLKTRYPELQKAEASLAASQKLVASYHKGDTWTPLDSLTTAQRQQLNASLDGTVELLAPVAEITEPRKALP